MDPNETLRMLRRAIERREIDAIEDLFDALDIWLSSGGFLPDDWSAAGQTR